MAHVVRARLPSISIVVLSLLAASAVSAVAASSGASVPTPRPRPSLIADGAVPAREFPSLSAAEFARLREAIRFTRDGALEPARDHASRIEDRAARTLLEWLMLRSDASALSFSRYAAFLQAHPAWPGRRILQRRAEASLWSGPHDPGTVLAFFADREPIGAPGKLALARALAAGGEHDEAGRLARSVWRDEALSASLEAQVAKSFGAQLTAGDHRARLEARLYAKDTGAAMRAAKRLGPAHVALVKARTAVERGAKNAGALLAAVPKEARASPVHLLSRIQWLRRKNKVADAAQAMLAAPHDADSIRDADVWWIERRILVRELLDDGKAALAYRIARDAALPSKESLRVDQPFTAGWVALRFLRDPDTAERHFTRIRALTTHPTSIARADYWLGRTAEAAGREREARRHYRASARHAAAYYGQLARARLGERKAPMRRPPALSTAERETLGKADQARAMQLLYATDNRDLAMSFVADLDGLEDAKLLRLLGDIAAGQKDPRAMYTLGRAALARGLPFDRYAFPTIGLPAFAPLGPKAERSLVYAIARAESAFRTSAVSTAKAMGLMQVTAPAGRTIARRLGIPFDAKRLLGDPVYNVQMGAAEIVDLVESYDGNHVLAFVGYNAGRGRVKEWVARFGDPRDPAVDVVDWVERIPFTETRIYVQRVMENLQVYRSRFREPATLTIEADMRGARG